MSTESARQRLAQATLPVAAFALLAPFIAAASPQVSIERAGPPVPAPRTQPCEMQLFSDTPFDTPATGFAFTPPVGCPPPWAKVVLSMDLSGSRDARTRGVAMALNDVILFIGPTADTAQPAMWHVERDLTDYSVLFKQPGNGGLTALRAGRDYSGSSSHVIGSATLRFYPPRPGNPAPRVPDAVFSTYAEMLFSPSGPKDLASLPHNIERAYLDVTAKDAPFWYNCFTGAMAQAHPTLISRVAPGLSQRGIYPPFQGCVPHSYSDVLVTVDGTPAGVAPVFPWLPTHFSINSGPKRSPFWNVVDTPTDSAQSLDYVPYRVDLTPFAAILNEAGTHQVALDMPRHEDDLNDQSFLAPQTANLLVYLDPGKSRLPGAVTFNSLPAGLPWPAITDGLVQDGNLLEGRVGTRLDRDFEIRGYVDTSRGRVESVVTQQSSFENVRQFYVKDDPAEENDPPYYREDLWLKSTTQSTSRRTRNGSLLSEDRIEASYPLELHYTGVGRLTDWYTEEGMLDDLFGGSVNVHQQRRLDVSHSRHGLQPYTTQVREVFDGNHRVDPDTDADSDWHAAHTYVFTDNRGSCYQKAVLTQDGSLGDTVTGMNCPNGINHVRWYAHPDGSADGLSWQRP